MKKQLLIAALISVCAVSYAQSDKYRCEVFTEGGNAISSGVLMPEYGIGMELGYKITDKISAYFGIAGMKQCPTESFFVPVYVQGRYDILSGGFTPFFAASLGYNLRIPAASKWEKEIKYNTDMLDYRWKEQGFSSRDEYVESFITDDMTDSQKQEKRTEVLTSLTRFENGSSAYMIAENNYFVGDGLFAGITIGCSMKVSDHRISLGISGLLSQYYEGDMVHMLDNSLVKYGYATNLPGTATTTRGIAVYSIGDSRTFSQKLKPSLRVRIGFEF